MEEQQIILEPEMAVIGGGAVSSVNGYTGDVVLTTSDLENTSDYQTGSEVQAAISVEVTNREAADNNLQTQIDALSASSDVTDIVGTYAELQNYDTSKLGDNDIIKVLQDESQNDETTYYRWSTTTQSFTLIGEEGPYYTKAQADALLNAKQDTLTAGANIQISNNTISATDTTYSNFTGTDGTAAGTAGLVPAPATTDAGKFLKADGTWDNAGGGVTELTSADYNWPENNPDGIAIWKLKAGLYYQTANTKIYITTSIASSWSGMYIYVATDDIYANVLCGNINNGWVKSSYNISSGDRLTQTTFLNSAEHLVQTTGTSTNSVMSQNATTSMVFADPNTRRSTRIGNNAQTGAYSVNIGYSGSTSMGFVAGEWSVGIGSDTSIDTGSAYSVAIGSKSQINHYINGAVALGAYSGGNITAAGMMDIGSSNTSYGYNSSNYRLLTGLYDGQSAHDAATYGQVISYSAINGAGAPTTATEGKYVGQLYYDTTNEAMYFLKTIDTTTTPATYTWEALGGGSSVNVVQTIGTSTTDVMSQKAVTDAIAAIPTGRDAFTELTSADYNYPADNPDGVAVWLLPLGLYKFANGVKVYHTSTAPNTSSTANPRCLGVLMDDVGGITGQKFILLFALHISGTHSRDTMQIYKVSNSGTSSDYQNATSYILRGSDIYNGLDQTSGGYALDARQGKVLNDKITALEARVAALEGN